MVKKIRFRSFLRVSGRKRTQERRDLANGLRSIRGHFTVDEALKHLQARGHKISRDTIYRNIPVLVEGGVLRQSYRSQRDTFYEVIHDHKHHDHLICRQCGCVKEFSDEGIEVAQNEAAAKNGFKLDYHFHELVGLCDQCQKLEDKTRKSDE